MIQRLCKVLVLAAAATLASCGGGGGGSSSGGGLPSTSSAPTPKPTPTPAGPFAVQWDSYWSFAQPALNVFMPKSAAPGDVLILALWNNGQADGAPNAYTAPAGWTQIDSGEEYYGAYQAFQHVVTAADTNTYAFTASSAARLTLWMAVDVANTSAPLPSTKSQTRTTTTRRYSTRRP